MKKFFSKALILAFGFGVAASLTACHNDSGSSSSKEETTVVAPKHSISGVILKADGSALNGAQVKINNANVTVSGNTFDRDGLADGTYVVTVTCPNYKDVVETVSLASSYKEVDGKQQLVGQNVVKVFYLSADATSTAINAVNSSTNTVVIETTEQTTEEGDKGNTTEENITAGGTIDGMTSSDVDNIVITDESGNTVSNDNFDVTVTNITSLEDAKAVARANRVSASRATRATTALPNGNELLAGVAVNAGPYLIALPSNRTFDITITMPENVKAAVRGNLFCTKTGDSWETLTTGKYGVKEIDMNQNGKIVIKMDVIQTVSFALGVQVQEATGNVEYEDIVAQPRENNSASRVTVTTMPYTVKSGVVLNNSTSNALTDFLRKIVLRKYGTRAVKTAKNVTKTYRFSPAYSMHPYGVLYLQGYQEVKNMTYSVVSSDAQFTAREYGDAFVYPYEIWTEIENTHTGGSN